MKIPSKLQVLKFIKELEEIPTKNRNTLRKTELSDQQWLDKFKKDYPPEHIYD